MHGIPVDLLNLQIALPLCIDLPDNESALIHCSVGTNHKQHQSLFDLLIDFTQFKLRVHALKILQLNVIKKNKNKERKEKKNIYIFIKLWPRLIGPLDAFASDGTS